MAQLETAADLEWSTFDGMIGSGAGESWPAKFGNPFDGGVAVVRKESADKAAMITAVSAHKVHARCDGDIIHRTCMDQSRRGRDPQREGS
jgi:hypothetical protein